jgi:hypothetical protein
LARAKLACRFVDPNPPSVLAEELAAIITDVFKNKLESSMIIPKELSSGHRDDMKDIDKTKAV